MESQPQNPGFRNNLETFTHVYIFNILHKIICVNVLRQQSTIFSYVGTFLVELVLSRDKKIA